MTDERQVRALLSRAAELHENIQPSVPRLIDSARRRRRLHAALALLGVTAVTAAGFTLPTVLKGTNGFSISVHSGHAPGPATAGELAHSHWSALPPSPLGPRSAPILVSAGGQLLELGGSRNGHAQSEGAAFNVSERRWQMISRPPQGVGLEGAVSVWTGWNSDKVFLTSGNVAGLYDLETNRWTTTELPVPLAGLELVAPVSTGHDVVLAGISRSAHRPRLAVAAYNVAKKTWRMVTPQLPRHHPTSAVAMVATWHKVILWSLWSRTVRTKGCCAIHSGVDVLELRHGRWTAMTGHWPQHRIVESAAFANFRILIPPGQFWCGPCPGPFSESPARFADAGSLALTTIPDNPLTQPLTQPPIWLWNGSTVLAADESGFSTAAPGGRLGRLAAYDPWSRRWHLLPSAPGTPALAAPPVFATQQLLVLTQSGSLMALGKRP
jgi:hypothetical protein